MLTRRNFVICTLHCQSHSVLREVCFCNYARPRHRLLAFTPCRTISTLIAVLIAWWASHACPLANLLSFRNDLSHLPLPNLTHSLYSLSVNLALTPLPFLVISFLTLGIGFSSIIIQPQNLKVSTQKQILCRAQQQLQTAR